MVNVNDESNTGEDINNSESINEQNERELSETGRDGEISNSNNNVNGVDSNSVGIFERFMDTVLGMNRNNNQASPTTGINDDSTNSPATPRNTQTQDQSGVTHTTAQDTVNGGAIVITVNYVFSDENNPQNPNRSGSLVMTLPNSSSNRDPRVIQEFIRLATQMAYSTIMQGLNKENGITVDKFNSFPIKEIKNKDSSSCSICFEKYDEVSTKKRSISSDPPKEDEDGMISKKRKTKLTPSTELEVTSGSNLQSFLSVSESLTPSSSTLTSTTTSEDSSTRENISRTVPKREPKFLSEFTGTFTHIPIEMPCGHLFGKTCLFEWLKNHTTCPLCRCSVADQPETPRSQPETTANPAIGLNNLQYYTSGSISGSTTSGTSRISNILNSLNRSETPSIRRVLRSGSGIPTVNLTQLQSSQEQAAGTSDNRQSTIISHLLTYLARPQQSNNEQPLFPTGVMSRRTESGVETRQSDNTNTTTTTNNNDDVVNFMNLQSLVADDENNSNNDNTQLPEQNENNSTSDNNDNNNQDHNST